MGLRRVQPGVPGLPMDPPGSSRVPSAEFCPLVRPARAVLPGRPPFARANKGYQARAETPPGDHKSYLYRLETGFRHSPRSTTWAFMSRPDTTTKHTAPHAHQGLIP